MKKNDIILIVAVILVLVIGAFVMKGPKEEKNYELPLTLTGDVGLKKLSYKEYQEKIDNNESFVFIVERTSCSHCQNFMPVAEKFAKDENLPMYYIDTDEMSEEDWDKLPKSNTFFKKKGNDWGTPTILVLAGKDAVDYIEGETTASDLKKLYKKYFDLDSYNKEKSE